VTAHKNWAVALAILAAAVYAVMWIGYAMHWSWITAMDAGALEPLHRYGVRHPGWVSFWNVLCTVFSPTTFRVLALVLIVFELVKRRLRVAVFLIASVELSGLLTTVAKAAANRPRPATAFVGAAQSSFPSGHAIGVMVGVLALAVVVLPMLPRALWGWAIATGVVLIIAVGLGRVVLNVHHPSDVMAGWALGYLWFAVCLPILSERAVKAVDETPATPGIGR
jgi:membrane-associated phospholipid phosphatase